MSIGDALVICLFGLSLVFAVLIILSGFVVLQSKLVARLGKKTEKSAEAMAIAAESADQPSAVIHDNSLKLIGVDEKTAAMIMAIVCHESGCSVNELAFKRIEAKD